MEQTKGEEDRVGTCEVTPRLPCGCNESASSWREVLPAKKRTTRSEEEAASYLSERCIPELFNFLIGHLVADRPDDPLAYLHDLLDRCLLFRDGLVEPPLLFDTRHIGSVYRSLDPEGLGRVSLQQYAVGMRTLGIFGFDPSPCRRDHVCRETFETEAKRCLVDQLKDMIAKPKVCY